MDAALRPRTPAPSGADQLGLRIGDDVRHKKFGEGVIIGIDGTGDKAEAIINFAGVGEKRLLLAWAPLENRSSWTMSSFTCSCRSANGLRPAPMAIGTVINWYSSTSPRRVSDRAKVGPPWTSTVPSSSRAFKSAIASPRSPPKISTGPQPAVSRVRENTALGFSFIAVAIGPSVAAQCGPMIS